MNQPIVESCREVVVDLSEKSIHVLLVDDEVDLLRVSKQCLETQGSFQVDTASSVDEALEKMKKQTFDVLISDYQMPGKDGLEFLETLRKNGNSSPFILFTGKGREEVAVKAFNLGADQYLNKTGDPETVYRELEHAIQKTVEQKKAERALETLGERYGRLFESAVEGILINGFDGRISSLNPAAASILGYDSPKELIGKPAVELYADPDSRARLLQELMEKGYVKERELTWKRKDGTLIEILASVTVRKDEKGNLVQTEGIIREVSERKRSERLLRESEEKYRKLFDEAIDAIFLADAETGILIDCNRAASELVGREKPDLIGKHQRILHPPEETKGEFHAAFKQHLKEKEGQILETQVVTKSGEIKYVAIKGNLFELQGKKMLQGIFRDITERKKMEETLLKSGAKYRALVEQSMQGIVIACAQGSIPHIVFANPAMSKILGYSVEELTSLSPQQTMGLVHPDDRELFFGRFKDRLEGKPTPPQYEVRGIRKDGTPVGLELSSACIEYDGQSAVQAMFTDITERKKTENAIRENNQKFEGLFRRNPEAAVYLDLNFKIVDMNPRFCQLFGYSAEEVKDKNINDVVAPENMREEAEGLDKDAKKGYASHNTVRKRKDGSLVPVSISAAPVTFENNLLGYVGIYKDISDLKKAQEESEESRKHFQMLFELMADPVAVVDGRGEILEVTQKVEEITGFKREELVGKNLMKVEMFGVKTKAVMIKNLAKRMIGMHVQPYEVEVLKKDGGKLMYEINAAKVNYKGKPADLVVFRDILERKNLEEKLRVVGSLTRHDVRNKLSAVTGNAYLLKRKLAENPEALEQLNDMENAVRNVEAIFEFARTYEKLGVEQLVNMNVGKVVDEAASLFPDLKGIGIANECEGLTVLADSLLRQLFYNLIDDSLKYGEKLTQIRVRYEKFEDKLKLIYEDDGVGISKDVKAKLFTEGFTTGKGSGYGLYLIGRMMAVYGWIMHETGAHGEGAQFTISIPKTRSDGRQNYKLS